VFNSGPAHLSLASILFPAVAVGFSSIGGLITYTTIAPACQFFGPVISRVSNETNRIALTFDDGPTPGGTDAILDILRGAQIHATFFVIGANVQKNPDLLRRIHAEGHAIGNHTWHHHHHAWLGTKKYWRDEIARTDDAIEQITGARPRYFRPPIGIKTPFTLAVAKELNHPTITWSRRARDGIPTTAKKILARFSALRPGDIAILHDGTSPIFPRTPAATIGALPLLLEMLRRQNLQPVRLDELLA
jgi:peptidoglycan/xylan/chitin deacetylase (PgdA/CDA1 family)